MVDGTALPSPIDRTNQPQLALHAAEQNDGWVLQKVSPLLSQSWSQVLFQK